MDRRPPRAPSLLVLSCSLACLAGCSSSGIPLGDGGTPDPANTFHVSTGGSDGATGKADAPWRTVQHAASAAPAGATVYLHSGVYSERVGFTVSGSAGSPTTFASAPGEHAIIDGTGLTPPDGTSGLVTFTDASYLHLTGVEVRGYQSDRASATPAGIYLSGAGTGVEIRGCRVHGIVTTAATLGGSAGAFGIAAYGTRTSAPLDGLVIDGNEVDHLHTGSSESVVVNGNVTHFQITNNLVHDDDNIGIDAIGFEGTVADPALDQARDGLIAGNTLYNITTFENPAYGVDRSAGGIYVDGGARIVIERNRIYDSDIGLEIASEHLGRTSSGVVARSNLIYANSGPGISLGGDSSGNGGTAGCSLINNSLYKNDTTESGSGEIEIKFHASGNRLANNLVVSGSQSLFVNSTDKSGSPGSADHNLYWSAGVGASGAGTWYWAGLPYGNTADLDAAAGGSQSQNSDPQLLYAGPPDLRVASGSPALGKGVLLDAALLGPLDLLGNPRSSGGAVDLGAWQQ
jgi:hypothetical protein